MKKIVASVGLVAIGVSGIESASAQALVGPDASKPWSLSATLRGFYDDNTATLPDNTTLPPGSHRGSFGFEVSPSGSFTWTVPQTKLDFGLMYSYKYFDDTPPNQTDHSSQAFTFNAGLDHSFSEQTRLQVSDAFVIGQEPDLLRAGNTFSTFQRVSGDNIVNHGSISFQTDFTPQFGIGAGYDNALYDYKHKGATAVPSSLSPTGFGVLPSLSGALDRIEQRAHIEGYWHIQPETKLILGYQFTDLDYTGDELVSGDVDFLGNVFNPLMSDYRNSRQHTVYVGAEHTFLPELTGSVRAGGSYTDYYHTGEDAKYSPYVLANLKYGYAPESYVEAGFSYDRSATDVVGGGLGTTTLDSEAAVVFADVNHRITPYLFGSLMGQFQNSSYHGGFYNDSSEQYYLLGLDLEYRFTHYFSAHAGYNYDRLESDLGRKFDRNRVYIGLTATY